MSAYAALDLRANEQPLPVTRDPQAIAKNSAGLSLRRAGDANGGDLGAQFRRRWPCWPATTARGSAATRI